MRKYASLESAQVLDLKGSQTHRIASLEKIAEFEDYRTEDGYLYARIRAISSRVNKNNDGWPSVELAGGKDVFDRHAKTAGFTVTADSNHHYGFSTFLGKPIFVDHNNSNPSRARGVIVDAKLHVEDHHTAAHDPYYSSDGVDSEHVPPTWVELLLEVDAKQFPKLAKAIVEGAKDGKKGIDGFSMGCDVEKSVCNICKNAAVSPDEFCQHVKLKGAEFPWINPKTGRKESKKSYENCYGIKFFEISAVFDPADETALTREVRSAVEHESVIQMPCPACHGLGHNGTGVPCVNCKGTGQAGLEDGNIMGGDGAYAPGRVGPNEPGMMNPAFAMPVAPHHGTVQLVRCPQCGQNAQFSPQAGYGMCPNGHTVSGQSAPQGQFGPIQAQRTAEAPLPQSEMMTVPEYVDTMREEEVCPVCGSNMDEGHQCEVCGYVAPPEGLDNPDLDKAQALNQPEDQPMMDGPKDMNQEPPQVSPPQGTSPLGNPGGPAPNNLAPISSVTNEMAWNIYHPRLAGKINPVERPIRSGSRPGTNEPKETIISDQNKPVTNRTAASMIAAATQGEYMSQRRTAANAPTADTAEDKRVDVTDVGGVLDATNEAASEPTGAHSWENAGTTVDVTGKGGILEDSNAEASKPSVGTQSLPTAGKDSDDAGFNKDKTTDDSGKTRTWDNSNEPNSAVTNKSFPTAATQHHAWGDERPYPTEGGAGETSGAKGGAEPADPVGKADERVDLLEKVKVNNPQTGTDQWTGTDGNGVTKQQDPVTPKVDPNIDVKKSSIVELFKIADTEVEMGLISPEEKYERIAELENASPEEIQATAKVLAKVKTAGLRKSAATKSNGVGRVPSFRQAKATPVHPDVDETLFW